MRRKQNENRAGALRTGLWTVVIAAVGALVCGVGGGALAVALPSAGETPALPVYTSLNLVTEDEPGTAIWQAYDADNMTDLPDDIIPDLPRDWYHLNLSYFSLTGVFCQVATVDDTSVIPWQTPASEPGSAAYLYHCPVPGELRASDPLTGNTRDCTGALVDVAVGDGYSVRFTFPDLPAATQSQIDYAQQLVQDQLAQMLYGYTDYLLSVPLDRAGCSWLLEAVFLGRSMGTSELEYAFATREEELTVLCDWLNLDLQTIHLGDELMIVLALRDSTNMLCVYYDVRLGTVSGLTVSW